MRLEKFLDAIPKLRGRIQLAGFVVTVAAFVATRTVAPDAVLAQISAGAIGVCIIVFGQLTVLVETLLPKDRAGFITKLFFFFLVFIIALVALTGFLLRQDIRQPNPISLIEKGRHLGDNVFNVVGGRVVSPYSNIYGEPTDHLLFLDKETGAFFIDPSTWGQPEFLADLAGIYNPIYEKTNLEAFKHICTDSGNPDDPIAEQVLESGEVNSFVRLGGETLFWCPNNGNYYQRYAVVAYTDNFNIRSLLAPYGLDVHERNIEEARFVLVGYHGSMRPDQLQQQSVELAVNGIRYQVHFTLSGQRRPERVEIPVNPEIFNIGFDGSNNWFAVVVLPFEEERPKPFKNDTQYDPRGPAHFRDVEIRELYLELKLRD
jgi:hypothetical protein